MIIISVNEAAHKAWTVLHSSSTPCVSHLLEKPSGADLGLISVGIAAFFLYWLCYVWSSVNPFAALVP